MALLANKTNTYLEYVSTPDTSLSRQITDFQDIRNLVYSISYPVTIWSPQGRYHTRVQRWSLFLAGKAFNHDTLGKWKPLQTSSLSPLLFQAGPLCSNSTLVDGRGWMALIH